MNPGVGCGEFMLADGFIRKSAAATSGVGKVERVNEKPVSVNTRTPTSTMRRRDIDGLRGLACLFVVLFHMDEHWLPGGYGGVDIFFVISGYVVTLSCGACATTALRAALRDCAAFYGRRVRRLAPLSVTCALLSAIAISIVVPTDEPQKGAWGETVDNAEALRTFPHGPERARRRRQHPARCAAVGRILGLVLAQPPSIRSRIIGRSASRNNSTSLSTRLLPALPRRSPPARAAAHRRRPRHRVGRALLLLQLRLSPVENASHAFYLMPCRAWS